MEPTEPELVARWAPFIGEQFPNEITPEEEIKIRLSIHFSGENNARLGKFPELTEIRYINAQRLFEMLRLNKTPKFLFFLDTPWFEARLLRLTSRFDECRKLCQSSPIYSWDFQMLREYLWASAGDSRPHLATDFVKDPEQRQKITQTVEYATGLYQNSLAEWEKNRLKAKQDNKQPLSNFGMLVFFGCIGASYFLGHKILGEPFEGILGETIGRFVAGFVGMFVGMILAGLIMGFMDRGKKTQDELDAEWVNANPRPKLRISDKPPIIRSTPDFIPSIS
jgi:hypothetical protein